MNQDHPQPSHDKYVIGDPSTFAEDIHTPNTWESEYAGDEVKRNEIGMPEMRGDTFNHAEKTATEEELVKKANLCISVAKLMLDGSKVASESVIEDQALALMHLPDAALIETARRLASDDEDEDEGQEKQAQDDSDEDEDEGQEKQASDDEDEDDAEDQEKQAGEIPEQFKEHMKEKKEDSDDDSDKEAKKKASKKKAKKAEDEDEDEGQEKQAQDDSDEDEDEGQEKQATAQQIAQQITATLASQIQQMVQTAMGQQQMFQQDQQDQMFQDEGQMDDEAALDQMLAQDQQMGCGPMAEADIQMDPAPMDDMDYMQQDDMLTQLFASDDSDEDENEGQEKQASASPSTRTVGTRPTSGVAKLGGSTSKTASATTDQLSSLWKGAPDVSGYFK